ncbi:TonB-dependent receptor [Dyella marensis]|jgi:outer membrane receptor for ferrienterochelin and colicin|uniref:TonB-dependent Receptor Plug Domain n=1 Tax=Dyella marensis TaxID=500610 RepID=A0A1I2G0R6_9GAMM|nr:MULTISPECIES: TonB-dependent receptor [Dyella]SFF10763.1 TonB-dependent Receptor Plug Domain [Dyella marensis]
MLAIKHRGHELSRNILACVLGLALSGTVFAQATTGSIFGTVGGDAAGSTVVVQGDNGVSRRIPVGADGRYQAGALPVGNYKVMLERQGAVVATHDQVSLRVSSGTQVDFAGAAAAVGTTNLQGVQVTASALPPIDVSSVDSRTVITAQQLDALPLARTAEDIALLAPGTVTSGSNFTSRIGGGGDLVSFGGASGAENAYYINGFNTTDPYKGQGALQLPYGSIDQQEVLTGGYSSMYGRSDGGVISQVGKSGTNDWHYGAQVQWTPRSLMSSPDDIVYARNRYAGKLYQYRQDDKSWRTTYSAYVGGPLIKDRLYFFVAAEADKEQGSNTATSDASSPSRSNYTYTTPKWYAKLNWNITDNHLLELTGIQSEQHGSGSNYAFDYDTHRAGAFQSYSDRTKTGGDAYIIKYTGYLTDNITLSAMYGKMRLHDYSAPVSYDPNLPYLQNIQDQNLALTGGRPIGNSQSTFSVPASTQGSQNTNLRIDLEWRLGDHKLNLGIDDQTPRTIDQGSNSLTWTYAHNNDATAPVDPANGIGAPGGNGYYVMKEVVTGAAGVKTVEHAQYLEDTWQVTDRFLLNVGLRNDAFANYNNSGQKFTSQNRNWSPRLGFSWDVYGDASLKVYGNAGRYYLAINNNTAYDGATGYAWNRTYYTYTGIDANGMPTGLTPFGYYDVNGHTGQAPDPRTVASKNLGAEYQDEFILGATKAITPEWITGVKGTFRVLRQISDDVCDSSNLLIAKTKAMYNLTDDQITANRGACYIFNPGKTNNFDVLTTQGYLRVPMSNGDWGFAQGPKRKYYALEMFLEHPLGKDDWGGRLSYVYSRSYGNSEGLLQVSRGNDSVGVTQDWDNAYVMDRANGVLGNNRTHQVKAYGTYRISPEWMVSGVANLASGGPHNCLGFYGTDQSQPDGYGSYYHWCNGKPSVPGSMGDLPWTYRIDLNVTYRPAFADHKLAFNLSVFNVLNQQRPLVLYTRYNNTATPDKLNDLYDTVKVMESPRYVRFGVSYDF